MNPRWYEYSNEAGLAHPLALSLSFFFFSHEYSWREDAPLAAVQVSWMQ